jgi:predicted amidohydrolase
MTRIALFQSNTGIDPAANARDLVDAVGEAAAGGAAMLFTPEMSGLLDRDVRARRRICPKEEDRCFAACRGGQARAGIWLHLGSLA